MFFLPSTPNACIENYWVQSNKEQKLVSWSSQHKLSPSPLQTPDAVVHLECTHARARMQTTSPDHSKCIAGQRSAAAQGRPAEESHTFTPPEIITIYFHLSRVYSARRPPLAAFPTVHSVASNHNSTIVNALTERLCCSVALMKLAERGAASNYPALSGVKWERERQWEK